MTTAFSAMSTKLQVGTAAVAVAAAAVLTPAVAHSAPSIAPFSQNVGNSAELLLESAVIPSGKSASANATASATPSEIVQTFVSGLSLAARNAVLAGAQYFGAFAYGGLAFTGLVFSTFGLTALGDGFTAAAWNVAKAVKIGPYSTSA